MNAADRGLTSGVQISGMRPTSPKVRQVGQPAPAPCWVLAMSAPRHACLQAWELISKTLKKSGVSFVGVDAVEAAVKRGTPVIDIR